MTTDERISLLETRIQVLEDRFKQPVYEQPDFIPDDKDAPEWANWKAMDRNGLWHWYSDVSYISDNEWLYGSTAIYEKSKFCTNTSRIDPEYWKRSLMEVKR